MPGRKVMTLQTLPADDPPFGERADRFAWHAAAQRSAASHCMPAWRLGQTIATNWNGWRTTSADRPCPRSGLVLYRDQQLWHSSLTQLICFKQDPRWPMQTCRL